MEQVSRRPSRRQSQRCCCQLCIEKVIALIRSISGKSLLTPRRPANWRVTEPVTGTWPGHSMLLRRWRRSVAPAARGFHSCQSNRRTGGDLRRRQQSTTICAHAFRDGGVVMSAVMPVQTQPRRWLSSRRPSRLRLAIANSKKRIQKPDFRRKERLCALRGAAARGNGAKQRIGERRQTASLLLRQGRGNMHVRRKSVAATCLCSRRLVVRFRYRGALRRACAADRRPCTRQQSRRTV